MLRYLTAGESHGKALVAILEGIPSGLRLSSKDINKDLRRRQKGYGRGKRMDIEKDKVEILSGIRFGKTLGSPIALLIKNLDWVNWTRVMSIEEIPGEGEILPLTSPRPGHADLTGTIKYNFKDIRNVLERASARETAARVAVGSVCRRLLEKLGIYLYSRVIQIGKVKDETLWDPTSQNYKIIESSPLRCLNKRIEEKMISLIDEAKKKKDTLGGIFEIIVKGIPPGLGNYIQWDLKLDARLAKAIMSIQAIKGVEVGMGFTMAQEFGSYVQDEIFYEEKEKHFYRKKNNAGGIEGGMSNGEPIILRGAMKPISTLAKPLDSVDLITKKKTKAIKERADVCAVPSAAIIGEAVSAFEIARAIKEKFGADTLEELKKNYQNYLNYLKDI